MRKIECYLRIFISILIILFLLSNKNKPSDIANGVYIGFILADTITWAIATLMDISEFTKEAIIELVIILLVAGIVNSTSSFAKPNGSEAEAVSFLVFMAILALKIGWYFLKKIDDDLNST